MKNYKITNLKTNAVYFLTEPQKENFFTKNILFDPVKKVYNYSIINTEDLKKYKLAQKVENICFTSFAVCIMAALYLGLCELLTFIDKITIN